MANEQLSQRLQRVPPPRADLSTRCPSDFSNNKTFRRRGVVEKFNSLLGFSKDCVPFPAQALPQKTPSERGSALASHTPNSLFVSSLPDG
jgi:hypothetical protein